MLPEGKKPEIFSWVYTRQKYNFSGESNEAIKPGIVILIFFSFRPLLILQIYVYTKGY